MKIWIIEDDFDRLRPLYLNFLQLKDTIDVIFSIQLTDLHSFSPTVSEHNYLMVSIPYLQLDVGAFKNVSRNKMILACEQENIRLSNNFDCESFNFLIDVKAGLMDIYMLLLQLRRYNEMINSGELPEDISLLKGSLLYNRKSNGSCVVSNVSDIVFFEAEGDLCIVHFLDHNHEAKKQTLPKNISYLEILCNQKVFFRTHRKFLVNMLHIHDYGEYPDSKITLELTENKIELPLSRRKKLDFHNSFKGVRLLKKLIQ